MKSAILCILLFPTVQYSMEVLKKDVRNNRMSTALFNRYMATRDASEKKAILSLLQGRKAQLTKSEQETILRKQKLVETRCLREDRSTEKFGNYFKELAGLYGVIEPEDREKSLGIGTDTILKYPIWYDETLNLFKNMAITDDEKESVRDTFFKWEGEFEPSSLKEVMHVKWIEKFYKDLIAS